jgi:isoquinoline 1-oxidoreductase beta subunit
MPGVVDVVEVENGVAVVAESYWQARTAADALDIEFDEGEDKDLNTADIFKDYVRAIDSPGEVFVVRNDGDVNQALAGAAQTVEAVYEVPFLAHTCMEPMNCTVRVDGDRAEIWVGSQSPTMASWGVAKGAGVASENVICHTTYMGGGFGRRAELDWITQAAQIARAVEGRPIKFIWSREDDIIQDAFRPAAVARFKGGLDDEGMPVAWANRVVTQSVMESLSGRVMLQMPITAERDLTMTEGAADLPYKIKNFLVDKVGMRLPIQVGTWRSVGHSFNAFFVESFVDELAYAADQDPYQFRRVLLMDAPRHLAVLEMAAEKANWNRPRHTGYGRGIALHESYETIVAQVVDIFVSHDGEVRVERIVCVVDCGSVVNPDTVVAQMESGIVYGLSAVLFGEITIKDGQIVQQNFPDYEAIRLHEIPLIETYIMPSGEYPGGVGEPGTPPIAPAVTNAIFDAAGVRVRQLPLTRANFWTV